MPYALLVVACLVGQPAECRQHQLPLPQITNATACHLGGAVRLRAWLAENEGWRLTDAECVSDPEAAAPQAAAAGTSAGN
ncbi:hypothetical protein N825_06645 [Skermanella stibiiresistens SB22]|uniref:Uncharacterized protein n=1 Tax=Skermanella stibiiresistens SB22 TaxID=1385369 RepID=W9H6T9_9PROT|nr:hypothetical protein [Skermanella stibiiresistens]EWY39488.1 hypothetical protein N825_06645 [Skermanella stibiiresistens SB22]